jgi:phosphodiesterase/alkaline phosphatase D-like protein
MWIPPTLVLAMFALAAPAMAQVNFPDGVASGDVTSTRAILWTRADTATNIKVEVFDNAALIPPKVFQGKFKTSAARDFTVKIDATGLQPNKQYWYRFRKDADLGDVGTFKTAPDTATAANLKLTYTGDSDGTRVNGVPSFNNFEVLPQAQAENGDLFVMDGDTIYSDSSFRTTGPATTLAEYQAAHNEVRSYPNMRNLLGSTSTIATMDDHEVVNDYDAETVNPARYAAGRRAFLDYWPVRETGLLHDPSCAGDPLYRTFHWGSNVDVFVLDERSCRSHEALAACPSPITGVDLGPTLPSSIRTIFPFNLFLTPTPAPGCLNEINSSARTLLGPVQKARFLSDLQSSTAQYKLVVNEDPIQQFWALPYDRWEGYGADRNDVLNTIRNNGIDNVLFLTTDSHATLQNQVYKDRFTDSGTIANEMVTGPIATNTFQAEVLAFGGFSALFAFNQVLNLATIDCRNLNQNSYAVVDTTAGGTTTITSKDDTGAPVTDPTNTLVTCSGTYGP